MRAAPVACSVALACGVATAPAAVPVEGTRLTLAIPRADGSTQPAILILPPGYQWTDAPRPLLVVLHQWGGDASGVWSWPQLELEAAARGWLYLWPDFRGPNTNPGACGSLAAQMDVLDATDWVEAHYGGDRQRRYLAGASGGGHMAMLLAGRYPGAFAAVSAWVGISDLAAWWDSDTLGYRVSIEQCTGGAPGASAAVDAEYRARSPLSWLAGARSVPLDLAAGIRDGWPHTDATSGSVPIHQTLDAFNVVARVNGGELVPEFEIRELSASPTARLSMPRASDQVTDSTLGRAIILRRSAGRARVTIFDGGHEGIASAAADFLARWFR